MNMDFDSLQKAGSRLGTGTMIVLDDRTCPVGMVHNLERFFAQRILRLVHAVPGRAAVGGRDSGRIIEKGPAATEDMDCSMSRRSCSGRDIRSAPSARRDGAPAERPQVLSGGL